MSDTNAILKGLVDRLAQHQTDLGLSDNAFCAHFATAIGTPKTWADRLKRGAALGKFEEVDVNRWITKLAAVVRRLDGQTLGNVVVEDLPITKYTTALYHRLKGATTDRRIGWVQADYGCGKSWALRHIVRKNPADTAFIEFDKTCSEKRGRIIGAIGRGLGLASSYHAGSLWDALVDHLRSRKFVLCLDEVHEAGVMGLSLMKSLVNQTQVSLLCGTYPTGLRRLEISSAVAVEEARQVLGRSIKPIETRWANGVGEPDVEAYLKHVAEFNGRSRALAMRLTPLVAGDGNLRQLADAIANARAQADEEGVELSDTVVEQHVQALRTRKAKQTVEGGVR